ncbi:hypothetical protein [Microvirga calopogonii]|uniref:hypothetical protein n=1 Tax=Microvirga calopogonii TaxID=2078013 RepID=UPI000E0D7362|nr:hypothetical protein [Microvirga calopogonii]
MKKNPKTGQILKEALGHLSNPGLSGEPMKQTDTEADEALAHIRRNTAAPIQRFLDSVAAARLEETTRHQNGKPLGSSKLDLSGLAKSLGKLLEARTFLKGNLGLHRVARAVRHFRRGE